jgi:glycosyltransferase involved in cell wall biosynthesis
MAETAAPRVTVVTATYNGERFLAQTLASIHSQTFRDFEYLVIDDASTDTSAAIVAAAASRDQRIRLITSPANLGPAGALNRALREARGEYIAVLDHDDLALPERLARQVAFLDANPQHVAVGAQVRVIDADDAVVNRQMFTTNPAVARWHLLFGAALLHSATMYRRTVFEALGGYSQLHWSLCDYDLLVRMADHGLLANLPDELACYRRSPSQVSVTNRTSQHGQMLLLQYAIQHRWLGRRPDLEAFANLFNWGHQHALAVEAQATAAMREYEEIYNCYVDAMPLTEAEHDAVTRACARRWLIMAHTIYATLRPTGRSCWHNACRLDPELAQPGVSLAVLRRIRRTRTQGAEVRRQQ